MTIKINNRTEYVRITCKVTEASDTSQELGESSAPSSIHTHTSWAHPACIKISEEMRPNRETYLAQPGPLDVGVLLVTDTPNHPVVVHGVDDGRSVLGSLGSLDCLQEERILVTGLLSQQFVFLQT